MGVVTKPKDMDLGFLSTAENMLQSVARYHEKVSIFGALLLKFGGCTEIVTWKTSTASVEDRSATCINCP